MSVPTNGAHEQETLQEFLWRLLKIVKKWSPEERFASLVRAGILLPDGKLAPPYRGTFIQKRPPKKARKGTTRRRSSRSKSK